MENKTECEIVQDLLLGYVDGVLNTESKKLVEKHLLKCDNCQTKLKEIKADINENESTQKKEIDYLKKIRIKNRIKSVILAIFIIFALCFFTYLYKFIIINNIMNRAQKSLQSNNLCIEIRSETGDNPVVIGKHYYKDNKYKDIAEAYSDDGVESMGMIYAIINSDERLEINERAKIAIIEKGDLIKDYDNTERVLKSVPFINENNNNFMSFCNNWSKAFLMSIDTYKYSNGKECYVLKYKYEKPQNYEIWIDKDTGLPIKEIRREAEKSFFEGTNVVKKTGDMIAEYKYEFGTVADDDVAVPDLSGYEIINYTRNFDDLLNK